VTGETLASIVVGSLMLTGVVVTGVFTIRAKREEIHSPTAVVEAYASLVDELRIRDQARDAEISALRNQMTMVQASADEARRAELRCLLRLNEMDKELELVKAKLHDLFRDRDDGA